MVFGFWGLGSRVLGTLRLVHGFWVWGLGSRVLGTLRLVHGFWVWGLGFEGFRVQGLGGFRALRFRVVDVVGLTFL